MRAWEGEIYGNELHILVVVLDIKERIGDAAIDCVGEEEYAIPFLPPKRAEDDVAPRRRIEHAAGIRQISLWCCLAGMQSRV
jgi:hypothetical protein